MVGTWINLSEQDFLLSLVSVPCHLPKPTSDKRCLTELRRRDAREAEGLLWLLVLKTCDRSVGRDASVE